MEIYIHRGCNSVASNNCLGRLYILLAYTVFGVFINLVVIWRILYALPFISYSWQRLKVKKNQHHWNCRNILFNEVFNKIKKFNITFQSFSFLRKANILRKTSRVEKSERTTNVFKHREKYSR